MHFEDVMDLLNITFTFLRQNTLQPQLPQEPEDTSLQRQITALRKEMTGMNKSLAYLVAKVGNDKPECEGLH